MKDMNKVLLALESESEIKAFAERLAGVGFKTLVAKDGAKALDVMIQDDAPALIIADTELPVINGEKLFQILRNNPRTASIPFLFISNSIVDIGGFKAGVDIFLIRPLNMEELLGRIRQTLSRVEETAGGKKEIEGQLAHMSLPDILQFLHLNRKEGELKLNSREQTGSVFIKEGEVLNALLAKAEGEKALFRLLSWTDGRFEFVPTQVSTDKKIRTSTSSLMMEGMRQLDELNKNKDHFPALDAELRVKIDPSEMPKGLQPVIYEIVRLLDSHNLVGEILDLCTATDYEVYSTIASMTERGILEQVEGRPESARGDDFLTHDQAIGLREKIISRFTDTSNLNYGKIFVISTSGPLVKQFLASCARVPDMTVKHRSSFAQIAVDNPVGVVATISLFGCLELHLYSIPNVKNMAPLWRAFSSNLVGLILLFDPEGKGQLGELAGARKDLLSTNRIPVTSIFAGTDPADAKKYAPKLKTPKDEPMYMMKDEGMAQDVFNSLFGRLLKDDYVNA